MLTGFDRYVPRQGYGNPLSGVLRFIGSKISTQSEFVVYFLSHLHLGLKDIVDADFVASRNFMIKVAESAHTSKNNILYDTGFNCICCKFEDVVFIWEIRADKEVSSLRLTPHKEVPPKV